ncbi:DUF4198 domain-containing protein [Sphingomonas sp. SAFR-052]|uniref:DUF4198 domain-containing protein n=1 Tax=Sphingomonas sp. SAFR-052 TaxID=3436867 RepID=UPI003F7D2720
MSDQRLFRASRWIAAGVIAALAAPSFAHGIWFAQRAKQIALVYGIGADDLDMVRRLPQVEHIVAYDAQFRPIAASARVSGPVVLIDTPAKPVLVSAVLQNGTWSRRGTGEFEKKGRDEMPDATLSERTVKYAVTIEGPLTGRIPALPHQMLQLVPAGPLPEERGAPLKYIALFNGKPQAGVGVIADMVNDPDAKEVETAADGSVTLPVRNQGLNVLRAVYAGPSDDPKKYDRIEHTATLAFTLPHAPE